MAVTATVLSSIPAPYTSSFKGLFTNFPLFVDHLNSPSRPGLLPALSEWTTKEQIISSVHRNILTYLITFRRWVMNKLEWSAHGENFHVALTTVWKSDSDQSCRIGWWGELTGRFSRKKWTRMVENCRSQSPWKRGEVILSLRVLFLLSAA